MTAVEPMALLDALTQAVGIDVREPDNPRRRCDHRDQRLRREMLHGAGRQGGHRQHRPVDGRGDPTVAAAEQTSDRVLHG